MRLFLVKPVITMSLSCHDFSSTATNAADTLWNEEQVRTFISLRKIRRRREITMQSGWEFAAHASESCEQQRKRFQERLLSNLSSRVPPCILFYSSQPDNSPMKSVE